MKIFYYLLALILLLPLTAQAQKASVTPVHGWLLGPSTLSDSGLQSCILFNQFSDGSGLRFTIRDEKVETITVIYRDNIFDPALSNNYKTILETSAAYRTVLDGYAYGDNTLTITPPDPSEFYGELKRNSRLTIAVPKDQRTFNLRNLAQNLERTNKCAFEAPKPQIALDETKEVRIYADLTLPKRIKLTPNDIWRVQRGERLSQVTKRWSQQSGKDLNLRASNDPILKQDFIYEGSADEALEKLFTLIH